MTTLEALQAVVKRDAQDGLAGFLKLTDFSFVDIFGVAQALVDGDFAAVQWVFEGVDCEGLNGMWPTGKVVVVRGLTLVDTRTVDLRFSRHIDWNSVNSQLGGSRGRSASDAWHANENEAKAAARIVYEDRKAHCAQKRAAANGRERTLS